MSISKARRSSWSAHRRCGSYSLRAQSLFPLTHTHTTIWSSFSLSLSEGRGHGQGRGIRSHPRIIVLRHKTMTITDCILSAGSEVIKILASFHPWKSPKPGRFFLRSISALRRRTGVLFCARAQRSALPVVVRVSGTLAQDSKDSVLSKRKRKRNENETKRKRGDKVVQYLLVCGMSCHLKCQSRAFRLHVLPCLPAWAGVIDTVL
ncbi:hypothetical protein BC835DRAFT_14605 [Cytidiella melzeri]|nr:hypothetical protein BC835DRAFT_14605 [Cytidiella melzeri]